MEDTLVFPSGVLTIGSCGVSDAFPSSADAGVDLGTEANGEGVGSGSGNPGPTARGGVISFSQGSTSTSLTCSTCLFQRRPSATSTGS